jgi:hypothetical protein
LSTVLGAEGSGLTPGLSYVPAESEPEWVAALGTLTRETCQRIGRQAFEAARERFDGRAIAQRMIQTLRFPLGPGEPLTDSPLMPSEDLWVHTTL